VKILAITANCGWLVFVAIMTIKEPPPATANAWPLILIYATLILNLWALLWGGGTHNWLSLFLQRKALEEQKKIEILSGKSHDEHTA